MHKYRNYAYASLVIFSLGVFTRVFVFGKEQPEPTLDEKTKKVAIAGEWLNASKAIETLELDVQLKPADMTLRMNLAQGYIQQGRITGDHAKYDKAALQQLEEVLNNEPNNYEALCCKATVLLSQHHFSEALIIAKKAVEIQPNSAFAYGLLCDSYVELGNYSEAVNMADKMVSIRPDLRSYARVSYLREIHGDLTGAIEAMKLAVSAGYPGLEETSWAHVTLGKLYEHTGDIFHAEEQYWITLSERPGYAYALAGLGRIESAKGNIHKAIGHFNEAKKKIKDTSFDEALVDLYLLCGDRKASADAAQRVIEALDTPVDESEEGHGHYADLELAYAYLEVSNYEKALEHALIEYERRPDNIEACEALAWVRYQRGETEEANKLIDRALVTKSQHPLLTCRAGLIKLSAGDRPTGMALLNKSLKHDRFSDRILAARAERLLKNS